jgi:hypothetical protein
MLTLDQQLRPHPEVVDTELEEGEVVLLQLQSKTYYSLNRTGARIWQGVKQGLTLQEISHRLQQEFAVDVDQATQSVLALVTELAREQLVQTGAG